MESSCCNFPILFNKRCFIIHIITMDDSKKNNVNINNLIVFYSRKYFFVCFLSICYSSVVITGHVKDVDGDPLSNVNVINNADITTLRQYDNDAIGLALVHLGVNYAIPKLRLESRNLNFSSDLLKLKFCILY